VAKIVVFDSGLGSLSIIRAIQKISKSEIIYFADQKNYPYGNKTHSQMESIIKKSLKMLQAQFSPDVIVMASNTPSLMLSNTNSQLIDVKPPLNEAVKTSKSKRIGILATESAIKSKGLSKYMREQNLPNSIKFYKINGSELVDLVETGKFLTNNIFCKKIIKKLLDDILIKNSIDTVTLSSTHLPFLKSNLEKEFDKIKFIDPGEIIAKKVFMKIKNKQSKKNSLKIFTSGDPKKFQKNLSKLKIKNKVYSLTF
jgi:glutamate racemase